MTFRLRPETASMLESHAKAAGLPIWRVMDDLVMVGLGGQESPMLHKLPPEALEIARECTAFLEAQENRPAALKSLRRAWKQALALARHDLAPDQILKPPSN
jgi:hypothetical protein